MASVPEVLDGQSDASTGEEMTQPVTVENIEPFSKTDVKYTTI